MKKINSNKNSFSDYVIALHTLVLLYNRQECMSSTSISENVCTNPVRVREVLRQLTEKKYVIKKMGKNGGYQFNNNYQNLTLKEIALSLEFEFLKNSWTSGQNQNYCMISQGMGKFMENLIYSINDEILNKLNNIKISDVEYKLTKI